MIYKIGRYYYKNIPEDGYGQPKVDDLEDKQIFTLVDFDGEPIKFLKRIKPKNIKRRTTEI